MPNRYTGNSDYKYGFNGMEKDNELKGQGNSYDFGARILDPRIGRWLSSDPLEGKFTSYSPYNFVANSPIIAIDPDGKDIIIVTRTSVTDNYNIYGRKSQAISTELSIRVIKSDVVAFYVQEQTKTTHTVSNFPGQFKKDESYEFGAFYPLQAYRNVGGNRTVNTRQASGSEYGFGYQPLTSTTWWGVGSGDGDMTSMGKLLPYDIKQGIAAIDPFLGRGLFAQGYASDLSTSLMIAYDVATIVNGISPSLIEKIGASIGKKGLKVDLMGGKRGTSGYINYDQQAIEGIADDVANFGNHFSGGSVGEMIVNNPMAPFLKSVTPSMKSGGTITIKGQFANPNFSTIFDAKSIEGFQIMSRRRGLSSAGYSKSNGSPIKGTMNEITLKKL